jgi:hypothetical protein
MNEETPLVTKDAFSSSQSIITPTNDISLKQEPKQALYVSITPETVKKNGHNSLNNVQITKTIIRIDKKHERLNKKKETHKKHIQIHHNNNNNDTKGQPINIQEAVNSNPPPSHQNHIYNIPINPKSKSTNSREFFLKHAIFNAITNRHKEMQQQISTSTTTHKETINDLKENITRSLQITEEMKMYINNRLIAGMNNTHNLRIHLLAFVRTECHVFNVFNYEQFATRYEYVIHKNELKEITEKQLSIDLLNFERQYQFVSQVFKYLGTLEVPLKYIIAKQAIEIGLKSVYQDELMVNEYDNKRNDIHNNNKSSSSDIDNNGLFFHAIDYVSEFSPIKMKRLGYYYIIIIDLALTPPIKQSHNDKNTSKGLKHSNK